MLSDLIITLGLLIIVALMLGLMHLPGATFEDPLSQRERAKLQKRRQLEAKAKERL